MTIKSSIVEHFSDTAYLYDSKNEPLSAIADAMHFLIRMVLQRAPENARVLCVGVGTGSEVLSLALAFPKWRFVCVDPAKGMLEVCAKRLAQAGLLERCELIHGYIEDIAPAEDFEVVLGILVAHFVKREERRGFYQAMWQHLRPQGFLVNTEISYDLDSDTFPLMLQNWEAVQRLMGASDESIKRLPVALREHLSILSPAETELVLKQCGIEMPVRFFQAFMISGWFALKIEHV